MYFKVLKQVFHMFHRVKLSEASGSVCGCAWTHMWDRVCVHINTLRSNAVAHPGLHI